MAPEAEGEKEKVPRRREDQEFEELHFLEPIKVSEFPPEIIQDTLKDWDELCPSCKGKSSNGHSIFSVGLSLENRKKLKGEVNKVFQEVLTKEEAYVLRAMFYRGYCLSAIAERLKCSKEEVEKILCSGSLKFFKHISPEAISIAVPE